MQQQQTKAIIRAVEAKSSGPSSSGTNFPLQNLKPTNEEWNSKIKKLEEELKASPVQNEPVDVGEWPGETRFCWYHQKYGHSYTKFTTASKRIRNGYG